MLALHFHWLYVSCWWVALALSCSSFTENLLSADRILLQSVKRTGRKIPQKGQRDQFNSRRTESYKGISQEESTYGERIRRCKFAISINFRWFSDIPYKQKLNKDWSFITITCASPKHIVLRTLIVMLYVRSDFAAFTGWDWLTGTEHKMQIDYMFNHGAQCL